MLESLSLKGKTVIVTGGGTGLGKEMVLAMAKVGADIVITARRTAPIETVAEEVRAIGSRALAISTDVTIPAQVNHMVQQVEAEFGKIDVLINNAGGMRGYKPKPIWDITDEEWRAGVDIDLSSAFYCSRAVAKGMMERGRGKIINVSTAYAFGGSPEVYMSSTAKAGTVALTRVLAGSLSRYGITTACIVPGFFPAPSPETGQIAPQRRTPFMPTGRTGRHVEMGAVAVYLASDASSYTNGEIFAMDGGILVSRYAPTGYAPEIPLEI